MKKITLTLTAIILCIGAFGQNACKNLFISEMIESNAPNRALELFNPTDSVIDLSDFSIRLFQNGQLTPLIIPLSGTIAPKSTFVIAHQAAKPEIKSKADMLDPQLAFDGNDAIVLERTGGTQVDKIGEVGVNPGNSGWQVPPNGSTKEQTLRRKLSIGKGQPDWVIAKTEWDVHPKDSVSDLSNHNSVTTNEGRRILVVFNDPNLSVSDIQGFSSRTDLILERAPSSNLPNSVSWTYVFSLGPGKCSVDPVSAVNLILTTESAMIKIIEPDKIVIDTSFGSAETCLAVNEFDFLSSTFPDKLWYVRNTGDIIFDNAGTEDADADICECWGEGFFGNGLKVAVIDFDGINFSHNDFSSSQIISGWNCVDDVVFDATDFITTANSSHMQKVSGLIVADIDNASVLNESAVGVAPGAEVIPLLMDVDGYVSQSILAMQKAVEFDADIINMSWGGAPNSFLHNEIQNAYTVGRNGLGCVLVAACGNSSLTYAVFPAGYPEVIGVGGSDPNDERGRQDGGWGPWGLYTNSGSNMGPYYDVVAPSSRIWTIHKGTQMGFDNGTSWGSAIVSGISALLLEKKPLLTNEEVRVALINAAEKVRTDLYDYNEVLGDPGRSLEMMYGRVNCLNTLIAPTVIGIEDNKSNNFSDRINVYDSGNDELTIMYDLGSMQDHIVMKMYTMLGREIYKIPLLSNQKQTVLSIDEFAKGVYVLGFYTQQGTVLKSHKIVKY